MADAPPFRLGHWVQDRVLRGLIAILLLLPYQVRVPLCGWLVARIVAPLAGYRARIRDNLARAMPELPEGEVRRLMRAVPDNAGRSLMEIYSGEAFTARAMQAVPHGPGLAALEEAATLRRPVILVSGHFGNYDAWRSALIRRGHPIGALYKPMKNRYFNAHYVEAMAGMGRPLFARGKQGMAEMIRHLRAGGMLGVLIDQHMGNAPRLSFFGQAAFTATSAATLALRHDALLVPVYAIRKPDGLSFDIVVEAPIAHGPPETMTQALNDSLEAMVRAHPEQWLWFHRRWKD